MNQQQISVFGSSAPLPVLFVDDTVLFVVAIAVIVILATLWEVRTTTSTSVQGLLCCVVLCCVDGGLFRSVLPVFR
jgi:hypothetical protein